MPVSTKRYSRMDEYESMSNTNCSTDNSNADDLERLLPNPNKSELYNIILLLILYVLQGIPYGLFHAIPFLLQKRNVHYSDQAIFSFVDWPFSLKLLWAPIVDSLYWSQVGRRKSWLVPTQFLTGAFMVILSWSAGQLLGPLDDHPDDATHQSPPKVAHLAAALFFINILAATKDVALDGWALTIFRLPNARYTATCATIGQGIGYGVSFGLLLVLDSPDFSNRFRTIPQNVGIWDLSGYLFYCGLAFMVVALFIALFKRECSPPIIDVKPISLSVKNTYLTLFNILKLPAIQTLAFLLMTYRLGFAAIDALTIFKFVDSGIHIEALLPFLAPMIPVTIITSWYLSKRAGGTRPLDLFVSAYKFKVAMNLVYVFIMIWTRNRIDHTNGLLTVDLYVLIGSGGICIASLTAACSLALNAFMVGRSDPTVGGTYMTLLTTMLSFGASWPTTVALTVSDYLDFKSCTAQDVCTLIVDGYYVELMINFSIGFVWLYFMSNRIDLLQKLSKSVWRC